MGNVSKNEDALLRVPPIEHPFYVEPDAAVILPLQEAAGNVIFDTDGLMAFRLVDSGNSWEAGPPIQYRGVSGTAGHLTEDAPLSGTVPNIKDSQGLVSLLVYESSTVAGGPPALSLGQSGDGQTGVTLMATYNEVTARVNNGQASGKVLGPTGVGVGIRPPADTNKHNCVLVMSPISTSGTRTCQMYVDGFLYWQDIIPESYAQFGTLTNTVTLMGVNTTGAALFAFHGLYTNMPPSGVLRYLGPWVQDKIVNGGLKTLPGEIIGVSLADGSVHLERPHILVHDHFNGAAGPADSHLPDVPLLSQVVESKWRNRGNLAMNLDGAGAVVGVGPTGTGKYNVLELQIGGNREYELKCAMQHNDTVAGGLSIALRHPTGVGDGFRVLLKHDGSTGYTIKLQELLPSYAWQDVDTATTTLDFRTQSQVLTIQNTQEGITA